MKTLAFLAVLAFSLPAVAQDKPKPSEFMCSKTLTPWMYQSCVKDCANTLGDNRRAVTECVTGCRFIGEKP